LVVGGHKGDTGQLTSRQTEVFLKLIATLGRFEFVFNANALRSCPNDEVTSRASITEAALSVDASNTLRSNGGWKDCSENAPIVSGRTAI